MDGLVTLYQENTHFHRKNDRFSTDFLTEVVQMVSITTFCRFV